MERELKDILKIALIAGAVAVASGGCDDDSSAMTDAGCAGCPAADAGCAGCPATDAGCAGCPATDAGCAGCAGCAGTDAGCA